MVICDSRKTCYSIVIKDESSACNLYAAEELADFLKKSTSVVFKICKENEVVGKYISLGNTSLFDKNIGKYDFSSFGTDGYILKASEGNVFINGPTDRAVLFGVYGFLEKFLGIRFISADTTYIKSIEKLEISDELDITDIPDFALRGYLEGSMYDEYNRFLPNCDYDFALRKKSNQSFLFPDEKHGGSCSYWGRGDCHNFHLYVSPEIYNDPNKPEMYHPEFFYTDANRKDVEGGLIVLGDNDLTICLSNGITDDGKLDTSMDISVAKVVIEELKKDIVAHPEVIYFNFDQEDGHTKCMCERCTRFAEKYKRSGLLIRFCNVIATELQKWADKELNGRKIYVVTFAYSYTLDAPVKEENGVIVPIDPIVVPCDNLIMRMAIGRDNYYSYSDERQLPKSLKALREWKCVGKRFFGWIYDALFDRYMYFNPSFHTIDDNVEVFLRLGMEYLMIQGSHASCGLWQACMHSYVYMAKLWDSKLKATDLAEEFLEHYFGNRGKESVKKVIKMFYDFYNKAIPELKINIYACGNMPSKGLFPKELLLEVRRIVDQARKDNADNEPDAKRRMLYDKHFAQVDLNAVFPLCEGYFLYFPEKTMDDYKSFEKEFFDICEYTGVTMYHEGYSVKQFAENNYNSFSFGQEIENE